MAWQKTDSREITFADNRGDIGGFGRASADQDQTYMGPIYSANGTAWYIVVDNTGVLSATQTKP